MERRLCWCEHCDRVIMSAEDSLCPVCGEPLFTSLVSEEQWCALPKSKQEVFLAALKERALEEKQKASSQVPFPGRGLLGALVAFLLLVLVICMEDGSRFFRDPVSAGDFLRDQMRERSNPISFQVHSDEVLDFKDGSGPMLRIFAEACRHTGEPFEGDELVLTAASDEDSVLTARSLGMEDIFSVKLSMVYLTTREMEEACRQKNWQILSDLDLTGETDDEKVRRIYGYITENVSPLEESAGEREGDGSSSYAAAIEGAADSAGIASLFYDLCLMAGLDCRISLDADHAFNFVRVGQEYYYADAALDLGRREEDWEGFLTGEREHSYSRKNSSVSELASQLLIGNSRGYAISASSFGETGTGP